MNSRIVRYIIIAFAIGLNVYINYLNFIASTTISSSSPITIKQIILFFLPIIVWLIPLLLAEMRLYSSEQPYFKALTKIQAQLELPIKYLFPNEDHTKIRANIMRIGISVKRLRIKKVLRIVCQHNMAAFRHWDESGLIWEIGKGACGQALYRAYEFEDNHKWTPVLFDRTKIDMSDLKKYWNIPDEHIKRTEHVKWIVSIPIVSINNKPKLLGILNIDGVTILKDSDKLFSEEFHENCKLWGENFGGYIEDEGILNWMKRGW